MVKHELKKEIFRFKNQDKYNWKRMHSYWFPEFKISGEFGVVSELQKTLASFSKTHKIKGAESKDVDE